MRYAGIPSGTYCPGETGTGYRYLRKKANLNSLNSSAVTLKISLFVSVTGTLNNFASAASHWHPDKGLCSLCFDALVRMHHCQFAKL